MSEKYSVHDYTVEQILNFIKSNGIAITGIRTLYGMESKKELLGVFKDLGYEIKL